MVTESRWVTILGLVYLTCQSQSRYSPSRILNNCILRHRRHMSNFWPITLLDAFLQKKMVQISCEATYSKILRPCRTPSFVAKLAARAVAHSRNLASRPTRLEKLTTDGFLQQLPAFFLLTIHSKKYLPSLLLRFPRRLMREEWVSINWCFQCTLSSFKSCKVRLEPWQHSKRLIPLGGFSSWRSSPFLFSFSRFEILPQQLGCRRCDWRACETELVSSERRERLWKGYVPLGFPALFLVSFIFPSWGSALWVNLFIYLDLSLWFILGSGVTIDSGSLFLLLSSSPVLLPQDRSYG